MYSKFIKRILDIFISITGIILFSPFYILIIIILSQIKKNDGIFFFQNRPGKDEQIFRLIKFKTMNDKKDHLGRLLPDNQRITKIGRFLRKTSLDEIPQLINVLKGEMSIIGPRPLAIQYLPYYSQTEKKRHSIRPGITGLAQVMGRKALKWEERFKLDVQYVESVSFYLDIKILILTIIKVIKRENVEGSLNIDFDKYRINSTQK
mgnify:CR=1 FL=1